MIRNESKNIIVANHYLTLKTMAQQARGLMFRKKPIVCLFMFSRPQHVTLHMWFVFFSIDVVYLDENRRVIELVSDFRPFKLYSPKNPAQYIIELPAGEIIEKDIEVGDILSF